MSSATPAPGTQAKPLSFMEKLDPLVSVYRPAKASSSDSNDGTDQGPRLIILASWTDARDVHIAKYLNKYQALYPAAEILLLRSTQKHIVRPSLIGPSMKHAASVVREAFRNATPTSTSPRLLIHLWSNGGSSSIANLYEQYAATAGPDDDKQLPPHVAIFDSCPGAYTLTHSVAFFSVGLSTFQRLLAAPILYATAIVWLFLMSLGVLPNSVGDWAKSHNDHPANAAEVRRAYIYSPSDALIGHDAVEANAADAKAKGFSVELENFGDSAHVAHVRKDEKRYWEIVRRTLEG